jgi:catechol 2,3-dioxygenase
MEATMVKPRRLGHLVLRVRDVEKSEKFYTDVLGLHVTNKRPGRMVFMSAGDSSSHELALMSVGPSAPGPETNRVGLYHFAWEMESFEDLKSLHQELKQKGVKIGGIGDHGISIGVYFFDPDGNEIEAFYELPRSQWPKQGDLFTGKFPASLEGEAVTNPAWGRGGG